MTNEPLSPPLPSIPRLLTTSECAEILNCSSRYVLMLIEAGELPGVDLGSRAVRVTPDDLERFIRSRRHRRRPPRAA
jgi:excisionase family DNA binding protein